MALSSSLHLLERIIRRGRALEDNPKNPDDPAVDDSVQHPHFADPQVPLSFCEGSEPLFRRLRFRVSISA
jgi:hypothetical protein